MRATLAIGAVFATAAALTAAPATAQPIDKGHFTDTVDIGPYDCDATPAHDAGTVHVNFTLNQRGSSPFPYYRESVHGSVATTNLLTGGTFTNVFSSNTKDHTITDNGDGTITITDYASGGSRFYDQFGKLVLKDPGNYVSPLSGVAGGSQENGKTAYTEDGAAIDEALDVRK